MSDLETREDAIAKAIRGSDGNTCISSGGLCRNKDGCICRALARAAIDADRKWSAKIRQADEAAYLASWKAAYSTRGKRTGHEQS